jgi:hypothetical protein
MQIILNTEEDFARFQRRLIHDYQITRLKTKSLACDISKQEK